MNNIILKPIPSSPNDRYRAGSDGQIYSLRKDGTWKPLRGCRDRTKSRYVVVTLVNGKFKRTKNVHRLICEAFHGPQPRTMQVRHLDGSKDNNKPENLCWGTQQENWQDRITHGNGISGEMHPMSKVSDQERRHIAWAIKNRLCSKNHAAKVLGLGESTIRGICSWAEQDCG